MKKTVLVFGLISGGILAAMMAGTMVIYKNGRFDFDRGEIFGYTSMILAFIIVFFGMRSYRENNGGGAITFGKAFQVGILMTLIACALYVVTWEIIYYRFVPDFADQYAAHAIAKMRASGASAAALAKATADMAHFKEIYQNPFVNIGMTFLEIFPVGLVMTLISAGILRKKLTLEV
ncbi:MAG: DUF4199 domain-containing protein [bacterium]